MDETRTRILDVALDVLGRNPEAGMGEVAAAAGVVRRTVYGHFPTRADLVRTLAERAVAEIAAVLDQAGMAAAAADTIWVDFVARLWPLAHRHRVLLALRRGEHGAEIHALLGPVDDTLADLVRTGQASGAFGRHLPPKLLSQVAYATVFAVADSSLAGESLEVGAATTTSLLVLGVPRDRAEVLVAAQP